MLELKGSGAEQRVWRITMPCPRATVRVVPMDSHWLHLSSQTANSAHTHTRSCFLGFLFPRAIQHPSIRISFDVAERGQGRAYFLGNHTLPSGPYLQELFPSTSLHRQLWGHGEFFVFKESHSELSLLRNRGDNLSGQALRPLEPSFFLSQALSFSW